MFDLFLVFLFVSFMSKSCFEIMFLMMILVYEIFSIRKRHRRTDKKQGNGIFHLFHKVNLIFMNKFLLHFDNQIDMQTAIDLKAFHFKQIYLW